MILVNKYENVNSWIQSLFAAAIVGSSSYIIAFFREELNINVLQSYFLLFFFCLVFLRLVGFILEQLVKSSRIIRRIIWGKEFIEGFWIDAVILDDKTIREFAIIEIHFVDSQFKVDGIILNQEYIRIGFFSSNVSKLGNYVLDFGYSRYVEHERIEDASGVGKYKFSSERPFPLVFRGSFYDSEVDKRINVRGFRILDKKITKKLRLGKSNDLSPVYQELAEFYFKPNSL